MNTKEGIKVGSTYLVYCEGINRAKEAICIRTTENGGEFKWRGGHAEITNDHIYYEVKPEVLLKDKRKRQVAKLAKEINDKVGSTLNYGGVSYGACNECKQTAYKGQPSIRLTDGQTIDWWNERVEFFNAFAADHNGELRVENFIAWNGEVRIKGRIIFPEFYAA